MNNGNYESKILDAIQIVVDNAISKAQYDRTIQATVVRCEDETIGDYVVHESHGLGIYRGLEKIVVERVEKDYIINDDTLKEKTFEKSERKLLKNIIIGSIDKAGLVPNDIEFFFGGDLLNQIVSSSYTARELGIPFVGLYSACATMAESLALSSIFIDNKFHVCYN